MTRRTRYWIAVLSIAAAVLYAPTLLYMVRVLGGQLATPAIGNKQIEMSTWWFVVSSPNSLLYPILGRETTPQVVFVKANGLLPGYSDKLVVSETRGDIPEAILRAGIPIKHDWGEILVLPRSKTDGYEHGFIREYGLLLTATDVAVFKQIHRIAIR